MLPCVFSPKCERSKNWISTDDAPRRPRFLHPAARRLRPAATYIPGRDRVAACHWNYRRATRGAGCGPSDPAPARPSRRGHRVPRLGLHNRRVASRRRGGLRRRSPRGSPSGTAAGNHEGLPAWHLRRSRTVLRAGAQGRGTVHTGGVVRRKLERPPHPCGSLLHGRSTGAKHGLSGDAHPLSPTGGPWRGAA